MGKRNLLHGKPRKAAAVVELAVTLPVLILVLLGIIEFGRAMMVQQLLVNGARVGSRRAMLDNQTNADIEQLVVDYCQDTVHATVTVAVSINGVASADLAAADQGDLCEISVSVPFSQVSFLPTPHFIGSSILSGSCVMEHE